MRRSFLERASVKVYVSGLMPLFLAGQVFAQAQYCASLNNATWTDSFGSQWSIRQSGNDLIGTMIMGEADACPNFSYEFTASFAQYQGNGKFYINSPNPNYAIYNCPIYVTFVGTINLPGCNVATGTETETPSQAGAPGYTGPQTLATSCLIPTGEISTPQGWSTSIPTAGQFSVVVTNTNVLTWNFGGRTVTETTPSPGSDMCWFSGSAIAPFNQVTGSSWGVNENGNNSYDGLDQIGQSVKAVYYYREMGRTPCTTTFPQQMTIDCSSQNAPYGNPNTITYTITPTTITSSRAAASETETYQTPTILKAIFFIMLWGKTNN
jgi:hypothetical protein